MATSVPSVRRTPAISIRLRVLVLPMVLAVFSSLTYSQNPESVQQPKEYEQFLAYWTTEAGWHSELQLRNNLPSQELVVSPVLRTADGTETAIPPVAVKPEEVALIDIGASMPQLIGKYGSVVLRYRSGASRSLYAAIMIHDLGHPIALHLDAVAEAQDYDPVSREGIWWLPNERAADYLVLTNQGKSSVAFDLSIYDAAGKKSKQIMTIGPRQTSRYSVRQLVRSVGLGGVYGGIKISAHAHAGSSIPSISSLMSRLDSLHS